MCTSTLESNNNIVQPLASFMIDENLFEVVHVELNCDQTHLFVLAANLKNGLQKIEYILYIYALETLSFDLNAPKVQVCFSDHFKSFTLITPQYSTNIFLSNNLYLN